jgi:hypothetical protein
MPQINVNGELREVSQAEYDALTTNGQASTPAAGSYEQYAAARAKEQAVNKLADADANFETGTNVSPEFRQELTNIRTGADAAAGTNKDAYAARYAQEQQDLYTNAPTSQAALREELSAPPPTTAPGTVGVGVPQQQGTDGQVIGTLNTTIPGLGQPAGPIVSEPVKGLTAGSLTAPAADPASTPQAAPEVPTAADPNFVVPDTDPQVPQTTVGPRTVEESQAAYVAAKDNPNNSVTNDGTVVIDRGDGSVERIRPDGSTSISDASGTRTFSPEGQATSQTSPTVNGFSQTTFADGATTTNQVIPLGPEGSGQGALTIVTDTTPDGTVVQQQNLDAGYFQAQTVTVDGQLVSGQATIADLDGTGQTVLTAPIPEQQTPGFVPAAEIDTAPAEVNPTVDPQVNLPADIANAPDPTVAEYFQNKAELEAVQKTFAVEEGDRATFVANPEERAEFVARLEENNQRLEAELEQKGLLDAVQQAEEQDRVENAAAQPPIGSLAELYPDDEPTAVSNSEIVGQTVADTAQGEQEILAAEKDVQQTEQQLATAEAELASTQQEIVDTVRAGGEPTTEQLETLAAQESEVAALEEQLATDEQALASTQEAQGVDPDPTTLTAAEQAADPEVSAFEEQQAPETVPLAEIETQADTELTEEQTAADPEVTEPAAEEVSVAEIDTGPAPLTDEEIAEYQAQTATQVNEVGANFQETFVSDEAAAAEAAFFQENPEAVRAVIDAPPPPPVESETEELDLTLEELEERVAETEADTELTEEEEAADPEITPQDDFVLSAADIDGGDDLDQDPGPGYGDVDEPLDPDILDRANEVEVDPYEDVLGRDLTEEEIQAEDNPVDYDLEEDIDPYNAIADRDLTEEEIQAEDNPIDYDTEDEIDPYNAIADRDLTEEEIQAEDNPIDYDTENEIDPFEVDGAGVGLTEEEIQQQDNPIQRQAAQQQATLDRARQQAILQQQRKQANDGDWRVKLRLAPGAQYLYRADQPGILQPLAVTDGVVFPYTPQVTTAYKANYNSYNLTHSNYRGYFYQGSQVEDIQINAKFTAQDSNEANYLLAVIHFFRSITKMFYGLDTQRGAPPPLVFLQGFGEYQFNLAPCVVAQFNYVLPDNVDYIRAGSPNINGTNLLQRRSRQDLPTNSFSSAWSRIQSVLGAQGIKKGAIPSPPAPPSLGTNRPTYVPTAMDINIILHPIQSRSQVSKQFSLKQYANGDLLKGGFW